MTLRNIALGSLLAAALIVPGWAAHAAESAAPLFAGDTVIVNDRFSDEIAGSGPDLVFIPGLASSRETWKAAAERLKNRYRLHLIQLAGFADEPARANDGGAVLVPSAEALDAYLVAQHLTPATLIGHSMGGTMILYLAEHHPADIKKAMMVDSLPFFGALMAGPAATPDSLKPMADAMRSGKSKMSDQQRDQMLASMATSPTDRAMIKTWGKDSDSGVVANAMADDITLDLSPGLGAITTPITLLYPDYAPLGSPAVRSDVMYHGVYAAAKTVKTIEVANSVHFIMLDQPAQFNAALDNFLAN